MIIGYRFCVVNKLSKLYDVMLVASNAVVLTRNGYKIADGGG